MTKFYNIYDESARIINREDLDKKCFVGLNQFNKSCTWVEGSSWDGDFDVAIQAIEIRRKNGIRLILVKEIPYTLCEGYGVSYRLYMTAVPKANVGGTRRRYISGERIKRGA